MGHCWLAYHQTQAVPTITSTAPLCMSPGNPFVVSLKAIATVVLWAVSWVAGANTPGTVVAVAATPSIDFTPAEKAYIAKASAIKMCVDPDWAPFERINAQGQH